MADPIYRDRITYRNGPPLTTDPPPVDLFQVNAAAAPTPDHFQVNAVGAPTPEYFEVGPP